MIIFIGVALLAAPFILAAYLRFNTKLLKRSQSVWPLVEQSAHVLLEDRNLSPRAGDMVEFIVKVIGSGWLTVAFFFALVFRRKSRKRGSNSIFAELNREQEERFVRFFVAALYFDSLRAPIFGVLVRRFLYWLPATAADKTTPVSRHEVEPVVNLADRHMAHA